MDEELRRLERQAASGDPDAMIRLEAYRRRVYPSPPPMTETEEVLSIHLGDQRDQPDATLEWRWGLEFSVNTFHFMNNTLVYDHELQERFEAFVEENGLEDNYDLANMQQFVDEEYPDAGGIYGDSDPFVVNTYNHENCLDNTLQYVFWSRSDNPYKYYVLVQIHLGGDVRGNYSSPFAFTSNDNYELGFLDDARGIIYCSNEACGTTREYTYEGKLSSYFEATRWYTENCHRWHGEGDEPDLEDLEVVQEADLEGSRPEDYLPDEQLIIVLDNDRALCPICRTGTLTPAAYHS